MSGYCLTSARRSTDTAPTSLALSWWARARTSASGVGPRLVTTRTIDRPARFVSLRGLVKAGTLRRPFVLTLRVDDRPIGRHWIVRSGSFLARIPLADPLAPGSHTVEVEANRWFVPGRSDRSGDFRPLAWRLIQLDLKW